MYRTLRHLVEMNMALEIFRNDVLEQSAPTDVCTFEFTFNFEISILLSKPLIQNMFHNVKYLRSRFGNG